MVKPITAGLAALATLVAADVWAGQNAAADRDMAELAAYRLTVPVLQKVKVATKAFAEAMQNDPAYREFMAAQAELKTLRTKDDPSPADEQRIQALEDRIEALKKAQSVPDDGDAPTLDAMERKMAKVPHLSESLRAAGLSPREFAKFELAGLQAAMVAGFKKSGQLKELPPGVPAENVQFILDHEKEIADINEMMQALGK